MHKFILSNIITTNYATTNANSNMNGDIHTTQSKHHYDRDIILIHMCIFNMYLSLRENVIHYSHNQITRASKIKNKIFIVIHVKRYVLVSGLNLLKQLQPDLQASSKVIGLIIFMK